MRMPVAAAIAVCAATPALAEDLIFTLINGKRCPAPTFRFAA